MNSQLEILESEGDRHLSDQLSTQIISTETGFYGLRESWRALADESDLHIFQSHEWLWGWWKYFGRHPRRALHIMTVSVGKKLIGIAPFYLGESSAGPVVFQRRLSLMGGGTERNEFFGYVNDYGYSDFLDIVVHPQYREEVMDKIAGLLVENLPDVDVIRLSHVNEQSHVVKELLPRLKAKNVVYCSEKTDKCPYLTLPGSLDAYIEQTGPSSRRRRLRNNLEAVGNDYKVVEANSHEQMKKTVDQLIRLHQKRWNSFGFPGAFYDRRHLEFVKEMCDIFYHNNWLWLKKAVDGRGLSAARMAIIFRDKVYDWLSGYDDTAPSSKFRPGLGLLSNLISDSIESGNSRLELMRGDERYKYDFTSESGVNQRITLHLHDGHGRLKMIGLKILENLSVLYYRVTREMKLLHVQYQQSGMLQMIYRYISFRVNYLKQKF